MTAWPGHTFGDSSLSKDEVPRNKVVVEQIVALFRGGRTDEEIHYLYPWLSTDDVRKIRGHAKGVGSI